MMWKTMVFGILTCSLPASADTFYYQNFPGVIGSNGSISLSGYGWTGAYGSSSTPLVAAGASSGNPPGAQVSNGGSAPSSSANTANAPTAGNTNLTAGAAFFATTTNAYQYVLSTSTASTEVNNPTSFSWYGAGNTGDSQQLIVEIGTQWYASSSVLSITQTNFSASSLSSLPAGSKETITFMPNTPSWYPLTYSVGSDLVLGTTPTALPSRDVAGYGVYIVDGASGSDHAFVDSFEVDTPEPSSLLLLLLGGPAWVFGRWRTGLQR